ncbi:MAG: hypothetical protein ACRCTD_07145 [Beijerinckiaceae bacterium]
MSAADNTIRIVLADVPGTDAFGLSVQIGGSEVLETICADAPGIVRWFETVSQSGALMRRGWMIGFLQRGPLRMPVTMPCDGWVLAAASDGERAGHGTPLFRILRATEAIMP